MFRNPHSLASSLRSSQPRRRWLALGLLCGLLWPGTGEGADLMEVYRLARAQAPGLLGQQHAEAASRWGVRQARSALLPQVSVTASGGWKHEYANRYDEGLYADPEVEYETGSGRVTVTQTLFNAAQMASWRKSRLELDMSGQQLRESELGLMLQVAESYLGVLAARDNLAYTEAEEQAARGELELVSARHRRGLANPVEYHEVLARHANMQAGVLEARQLLVDSQQGLQALTGEAVDDLSPLRERFPLAPPEQEEPVHWLELATAHNPTLRTREAQLAVARQDVTARQAGHLPTVDVTYQYGRDVQEKSLASGRSEKDDQSVMVNVTLPLYQGGGVQAAVSRARELEGQAEQQSVQARRQVERTLHAALRGILTSISRNQAMERSVEGYRVALEAKRKGLKTGLYTSIDVLDAMGDYQLARKNLARARYDYLIESLRLKHTAGILTEEDLALVNSWLQGGEENGSAGRGDAGGGMATEDASIALPPRS